MEKSASIQELLELRREYEQEKIKFSDKKEALSQKKEEIHNQIIEKIKSESISFANNERLQKYLENTYTSHIEFLYRSINFMAGNNQKGNLSFQELLLLDEEVKNIASECKITSGSQLFKIFLDYSYFHKSHPFLENEKVKETMNVVPTLAYLDRVFQNIDNILNYQGSYIVYQYVKNYLNEVLKEGMPQTDQELIYKDYDQKVEYVLANISSIATYLMEIRDQIPDSRLALSNQGLSRTAKKIPGSGITLQQKIFAQGIAFGTTLEKLENRNYEDSENLIYIPHQKLLK